MTSEEAERHLYNKLSPEEKDAYDAMKQAQHDSEALDNVKERLQQVKYNMKNAKTDKERSQYEMEALQLKMQYDDLFEVSHQSLKKFTAAQNIADEKKQREREQKQNKLS